MLLEHFILHSRSLNQNHFDYLIVTKCLPIMSTVTTFNVYKDLQPKCSYGYNNGSWCNVVMKILAYDRWMKQFCVFFVDTHKTIKNHECSGICKDVISILKNMIKFETLSHINNPVDWIKLNKQEFTNIVQQDNVDNSQLLLEKILQFLCQFSLKHNYVDVVPFLIHSTYYEQCQFYPRCSISGQQRKLLSSFQLETTKHDYNIQTNILSFDHRVANSNYHCHFGCPSTVINKSYQYSTNKILIITLMQQGNKYFAHEFDIPQYIMMKQQTAITKCYKLHNIILRQRSTNKYACIINSNNRTFCLQNLQKQCSINNTNANLYNNGKFYENYNELPFKIRFYPVVLVYHFEFSINTLHNATINSRLKLLENNTVYQCNIKTNVLQASSLQSINHSKSNFNPNVETNEYSMEFKDFDSNSVISRLETETKDYKHKKKKQRTNDQIIKELCQDFENFKNIGMKLNLNLNYNRNLHWCQIIHSIFRFPIYKYRICTNLNADNQLILNHSVKVTRVLLNKFKSDTNGNPIYSYVVGDITFCRHKVHKNGNGGLYRCVVNGCNGTISMNHRHGLIQINSKQHNHGPYPHFRSICKRYI